MRPTVLRMNPIEKIPEPEGPGAARAGTTERSFRFFVETLTGSAAAPPPAATDLPVLEVPKGLTYLAPGSAPLTLVPNEPSAAALVLEPVHVAGRPRLLLMSPGGLHARLNGQAVPALALLKVGDQLQIDAASAILHVTEHTAGGATPPAPELVGQPCGVCRLALTADTAVYVCSGCSVPLHLEGPPKAEGERLECAMFGDCPSCGAEVRTSGGYAWVPEL